MNFDKILEYQKVDQNLVALETEVSKSSERAAVASAKFKIDAAAENVGKLSGEAGGLLNGYTAMKIKIDSLKAKLDEFDGVIEGMEDASEADYYLKQVSAIADEITALEKESWRDAGRIDEVGENYKKTWEAGIKASDSYKAARLKYNSFVEERQPKIQEITARLNEIKNDVPPELLKIYVEHRQAKKLPAFVEFDPKVCICRGCNMEVANDTRSRLKNPGDYVACPNCGRIMFVPEK